MDRNKKLAVVLFNLGGPQSGASVRPFLFNLFSDKHIITLPAFLRLPLAWWIAKTRAPLAQKNYNFMNYNGGSPLLKNTTEQAHALEKELHNTYPHAKVFIAMRYWHPRAAETLTEVEAFNPDEVVLLPLYPHYSTTTTESSLSEWQGLAKLSVPTHAVCCWWNEAGFIEAHAEQLKEAMRGKDKSSADKNVHILFSAHGVPENLIKKGDPYQRQSEDSARLIARAAGLSDSTWSLAYQSRVGRLKWLAPETGAELVRLTQEQGITTIFIIPLSFVSEHIETLVELDIKFKELATAAGLRNYHRVPTLACSPRFIETLAGLIGRSLDHQGLLCPDDDACTTIY